MGEARDRKSDKFYGLVPKAGMGLVISSPMHFGEAGTGYHLVNGIDAQELRFSTLLWDRLVWPKNSIVLMEGGVEENFLEKAGVLKCPLYELPFSGDHGRSIADVQYRCFEDLNAREPGLWALAQGDNSFLDNHPAHRRKNGTMFQLTKAIPVPDRLAPIAEVLEFKTKRRDELLALRIEIERFVLKIAEAGDNESALRMAVAEIEQSCIDVLKVAAERKLPSRLATLRAFLSIDLTKFVGRGLMALGATGLGLPVLGAACSHLGAAMLAGDFSIKIQNGMAGPAKRLDSHPFRYVSSFSKEILRT